MSERYFITGVQLGMLIAIPEEKERHKIVDGIIDKQFLGNVNSPQKPSDVCEDNPALTSSAEVNNAGCGDIHNEMGKDMDKDINKRKKVNKFGREFENGNK